MSKAQKNVLICIAIIIVLMLLFPPFTYRQMNQGYSFIFNPPYYGQANINIGQLIIQWFGVLIVGAIAWLIVKD